jgi:hypothetical protein
MQLATTAVRTRSCLKGYQGDHQVRPIHYAESLGVAWAALPHRRGPRHMRVVATRATRGVDTTIRYPSGFLISGDAAM